MKKPLSDHDAERYKRANRLAFKHYWQVTKKNRKTAIPGATLPAIDTILTQYVPPLALASIISVATTTQNPTFADFLPFLLLFGISWTIGEILMRIGMQFLLITESRAIKQLYNDGVAQLLKRDISFFNDNFAGSLTKKTIGYAGRYELVADTLTHNVISKIIPTIFALIVLATYSPWISLLLIGWVAIAIMVVFPMVRYRQKLVNIRETASNKLSGHIADVYANVGAVKAQASEDFEQDRNAKLTKDYVKKMKRSWDYQNLRIDISIAPIYVLSNLSGLILGLYLAQNGVIEYANIIVIFSYYTLVTFFMWEFNNVYRRLETAFSDAAQYTELLLTEPTILDSDSPRKIDTPQGFINFKDVTFSYDKDENKLFNNFSLSIPAGQKFGLVGRSGGGKTSITKLLLRFVDIDGGAIEIDGVPINQLTQHELRSLVSYVPQDPIMFHRTIKENIAYAKPDATEEEILDAAKKAHAHEFIKDLPKGYETLVGERGVKLSGGQRQRIAIARAILKNAPILLLDEATSALDSESENLIQDALWKLMEGKTAIVIAHRLSTIQKMDQIIVLDKGSVAERGTHTELTKQKGIYAELWAHQSGGFIDES